MVRVLKKCLGNDMAALQSKILKIQCSALDLTIMLTLQCQVEENTFSFELSEHAASDQGSVLMNDKSFLF